MKETTFRELEHRGWTAMAHSYRNAIGVVTAQAIDPLLDTFGNLAGKRLLDVACGPGDLAAAAAARGAIVEGVDFSAPMIAIASRSFPRITFREADAEKLPHDDGRFDAVACGFGLLHFPNAERAIAEAWRVLRPEGRYTFCVWQAPDHGGGFFELVLGAIERHGTLDVALPPAPPFFRFADVEACRLILTQAGFAAPVSRTVELRCRLGQPSDVLDFIRGGAVRLPLILDAQTEVARQKIEQAIVDGAQAYRRAHGVELRMPVVVTTAQRR